MLSDFLFLCLIDEKIEVLIFPKTSKFDLLGVLMQRVEEIHTGVTVFLVCGYSYARDLR